MVLICCIPSAEASFNWIDLFSAFGPVLLGLGGYMLAYWQIAKPLKAAKNEREIRSLSKKLNEFYGPFYQLRKKSNSLYDEFRKECERTDSTFTSTLNYLLEGKTFSGNAAVLLTEIIVIGEMCERIIHEKAGLIDHNEIRNDLLPRLTTHYRLLKLATEGKLKGGTENIGKYTFPTEIDGILDIRIKELSSKIADLNRN